MSRLRSERLDLRPSRLEDLPALLRLWTDPEVRRFLFDGRVIGSDEARGFVARSLASFRARGFGLWVASLRGADEIAGFVELLAEGARPPSLIYGLRPELAGRGLATEAARAVLDYALRELGLGRLVADVDEPNRASVRVLEKLGFRRSGRRMVEGRPVLDFELAALGAPSDAGTARVASDRCPLCGGDNACALVAGSGEPCWCARAAIPPATLARIPAEARGIACLCARCAGVSPPSRSEVHSPADDSAEER